MVKLSLYYSIISIFCLFSIANANDQPIRIQRVSAGSISFDGVVDEAAWRQITPFPLVTHWPEFGNDPSDLTEIRVAYDDSYIYVSGIMHAAPENVLAASFQRDLHSMGTDYLTIVLDTFDDNQNALLFATTPTGNRNDLAVSEDAENIDTNWNTFWDAEATENEYGWSAEIRIPFSSLGFQDQGGSATMGMILYRYTARKNEMTIYPAVQPNWGFWSFVKPSQMQKVIFEGVKSDNPVYLTPYALAGVGQNYQLNDGETAYRRDETISRDLGLDLKYNVTDNLTLDFSLNTDFAQVEADDQQINLTRFSLFFPEKRRFFLERASIFDFRFDGSNRLFYTRRIGLNDGDPVRILAGGRLVGRINDWDVGVLNVQTGAESQHPAENFGVFRLRRQVVNDYSYLGGMATTRIDEHGSKNLGYGIDGVFRIIGEDYLSFNLAQTYSDTASSEFRFSDVSRMRLFWENRSYNNFGYQFGFERAGKDYSPASGFEMRDDFSRYYNRLSYGWNFNGHPFFQRHQVSIKTDVYTHNSDGVIETRQISPVWSGAFTSGSFFTIGLDLVHEHLNEGFDLANQVTIAAGEYSYNALYAEYNTPYGNDLSTDVNAGYGTFFDGTRFSAGLSPKWIASRYLELSGAYQFNRLEFSDRNQHLTTHLVRLRSLITLNTALSFSFLVQYNSSAHISLANVRFRYNPREGNDLYIVYNEQFNSDRRREYPVLPVSGNRAIIAKYTHTFAF